MAVWVTQAQGVVLAVFWRGDVLECFGGFRAEIWLKPEVDPPRIYALPRELKKRTGRRLA
jgi:hypothetical protein